MKNASLQICDGPVIKGFSESSDAIVSGMVGYLEALTDPSYKGQILVLTYPLVGNYGYFEEAQDENGLSKHYESERIQISGLVVSELCSQPSHHLSKGPIAEWLSKHNIPVIFDVDTRQLTKFLRDKGTTLAKLSIGKANNSIGFYNPAASNIVSEVSVKEVVVYETSENCLLDSQGNRVIITVVDLGLKNNQIRCLLKRGVDVKIVPWDYDFTEELTHGIFLSNGPGDPLNLRIVIERLKKLIEAEKVPIFGICLGHQILALAAGIKTYKMKFGNRGHNIPCTDMNTGRCYITSQNHGYAVDIETNKSEFKEYFVNANDGSNEGIYHSRLPFFSVQFHPEAKAGPNDCMFLFDKFIKNVANFAISNKLSALDIVNKNTRKTPVDVKKVLILGSGGLSIGQAGEFDYSGSQAIKALQEENIYTILINPNIATTQTSREMADKVYFLPVNHEFVKKIILKEKPDAMFVTFGGQTALNVAISLKDEIDSLGVKILGTSLETIMITEDRENFAAEMNKINEPCAPSSSATNIEEAIDVARKIGYPVIARAAFTLGGLGSGFAKNDSELSKLCKKVFSCTTQVLIEKSLKGWKEIEYEIVRDINGNCITVCNMENFDPLGIHTGDSIVVAPSQTLSDDEYNMLRSSSIKIASHLKIVGECNAQFALDPKSQKYYIIEVNARLSRSSALASKATGYPLAFIAAKLGLHQSLACIKNKVTLKTCACFEPSLDYVVIKIPKWDMNKFSKVSTKINSSMKSVGEVMSIGRNFEEALTKAICSLDSSFNGLEPLEFIENIDEELENPTDLRLFVIANALHNNYSIERIAQLTNIDKWFLYKLQNIYEFEKILKNIYSHLDVPSQIILRAKKIGFTDFKIGQLLETNEMRIRSLRQEMNIKPYVKQIDTVAAEFPAYTNYLYMTYNANEHDIDFKDQGVIVLGSGVYRIGSSVEFDWCAVKVARTLRKNNIRTIMINYNPETVSTDYDEVDRLFFENITVERVLDIYFQEGASGVIVSMGGQVSNNIAMKLHRRGVKILGTDPEMIDMAENRYKFSRLLDKINVDQPLWKELTDLENAKIFCSTVNYPVLVRPSYVLSGAAMNVAYNDTDLENFLNKASKVSKEHSVVISKFIENSKEIELDGVGQDGELIASIITEHVENAGVHSGDATLVHPAQDLDTITIQKVQDAASKICSSLNVSGPFNIQFIAKDDEIMVIECNLRAARSFPFVSKVSNIDLIELCTLIFIGEKLEKIKYVPQKETVAVKVAQFSFSRLCGADPVLGVEMASTGEVACFGKNKYEAYLKALVATGFRIPNKNVLLSIGTYKEKAELMPFVKTLKKLGYNIFATSGTADFIQENGVEVKFLDTIKESESEYSLDLHLANNLIDFYINLPSKNSYRRPANYISKGYKTRRMAIDLSIPLITNIKCAKLFIGALEKVDYKNFTISNYDSHSKHETIITACPIAVVRYLDRSERDTEQKVDFCLKVIKEKIAEIKASGFLQIILSIYVRPDEHVLMNSMELLQKSTFGLEVRYLVHWKHFSTGDLPKNANFFIENESINHNSTIEMKHFLESSSNHTIFTNAIATNLATVLLFAYMYDKSLHIINVKTFQDVNLVNSVRAKTPRITFDTELVFLFHNSITSPHLNTFEIDDRYFQKPSTISENTTSFYSLGCINQFNCLSVKYEDYVRDLFLLYVRWSCQEKENPCISERFMENTKKIHNCNSTYRNDLIEIEIGSKSVEKLNSGIFELQTIEVYRNIDYVEEKCKIETNTGEVLDLEKNVPTEKNILIHDKIEPSKLQSDEYQVYSKAFYRKHTIKASQFTKDDLHKLFNLALEMKVRTEKRKLKPLLQNFILCILFYEPSTRTSSSFEAAMYKLGGKVIKINSNVSSSVKGESLFDTIRSVNQFVDLIVLRHPSINSVCEAAKISDIPIINGGDGAGEHPTQALLDVFTIREELGTVNGLQVTIIGDLKYGRTVHSLVKLLSMYKVRLNYISPASLRLPRTIFEEIEKSNIEQTENEDINEVIETTDVLYVTRIQKERFEKIDDYNNVKGSFKINNHLLSKAKESMIIMHPLPRIDEIDPEVDLDSRAVYFRQMNYGLYLRMALITMV